MIKIHHKYEDIFKQIERNHRKNSLPYLFIEKKISEHRVSALKSKSGSYTRQWNNFQANYLENRLNGIVGRDK